MIFFSLFRLICWQSFDQYCNFTNKKAAGDYCLGGAIYFNEKGTVKKSYFNNNFANNYTDIYNIKEIWK